jgi:hypothetical protein
MLRGRGGLKAGDVVVLELFSADWSARIGSCVFLNRRSGQDRKICRDLV